MRNIIFSALFAVGLACSAQCTLTLDSCRTLALRNNKELAIAGAELNKAQWERKAARTKYFPRIDLAGGYMRTSKEISILNSDQKYALNNMGTQLVAPIEQGLDDVVNFLTHDQKFMHQLQQILAKYPDLAPLIQQFPAQVKQGLNNVGGTINGVGHDITDAFRTDTRNVVAGAVLFTQPLYMGGKIIAYNKITQYSQQLAETKYKGATSQVILDVDRAYWQIVNLSCKKQLATQYRDMLKCLEADVEKMIAEGVATKANALTVSVKLNEAEMTLAKVEDGLLLSRMLLCQICGLPISTEPVLTDELTDNLVVPTDDVVADTEEALANRPELQQLQLATNIYRQKVNVVRSEFLPSLALTGGYAFTNPSLTNGFEKRFRGLWNVGVVLKIPVWNWLESRYKIQAARAEADSYQYRLEEAREKIELQVNQQSFRVNEANRKYQLSLKNLDKAQENLRTAQLGHKEGVITTTDLLAAQTAWLSAHSDKIDAQVDIHITRATLNNVLGLSPTELATPLRHPSPIR